MKIIKKTNKLNAETGINKLLREQFNNIAVNRLYEGVKEKISKQLSCFTLPIILIISLIFPATVSAHRGAKTEIDTCRISVGDEVVHFSAYTPTLTPGESYCHVIPGLGLTHLVIDYEGNKLRKTTVEYEVTKEPEGTRVFYQEPKIIKKGSMDAKIDFAKFGAGQYLTHITIMYQGEKLDTHLPFSVGIEPEDTIPYKWIIPVILVIITLIVIQIKVKKRD